MFCIVSCVFVVLPGLSGVQKQVYFSSEPWKEPNLWTAVEVMDSLTAEQDIP